jgi:DnaK suppressor protein
MSKTATKKVSGTKASAASKAATPRAVEVLTEAQIRKMSDDEYMNEAQLAYFRKLLLQMREEVLAREVDVKERLNNRETFADPADRATAEEEHWLDLRLRERESLLLRKIDEALRRIVDREYGYCEETGEPIGIPRLLARPTATVCVDVKGQNEQIEAQYRDR